MFLTKDFFYRLYSKKGESMLVSRVNYTNFNNPAVSFKKKKQNTNTSKETNNHVSNKISAQKMLPMLMALTLYSCDLSDISIRDYETNPSKMTEQQKPSAATIAKVFKNADLKFEKTGNARYNFDISTEIGDFDGTVDMTDGGIKGDLNTDDAEYSYTMKIYKEGNIKAKLNLKNKKTKETEKFIIAEDHKKDLVVIDKEGNTQVLTDKMNNFVNGTPRKLLFAAAILILAILNFGAWTSMGGSGGGGFDGDDDYGHDY